MKLSVEDFPYGKAVPRICILLRNFIQIVMKHLHIKEGVKGRQGHGAMFIN